MDELAAREGDVAGQFKTEQQLDITVLMGGPSTEREVSFMSGSAIADALERVGHKITRADISPEDLSALDRDLLDVVFIALHGDFGESGEVQAACEARGLRYTGSCPHASQLAMDKAASKQAFRKAGLYTPDWMIIEEFHTPEQVSKWVSEIIPPVVVKPVDGGSSIDVVIAQNEDQRDKAMDELLDKYGRVMLEGFVEGKEFTVSVLGDKALPVIEIVPASSFYDYTAKYADDAGTQYVFDNGLNERQIRDLEATSLEAHRCLGCRDMSRVDLIMDSRRLFQVLEINTIPGFTSHSLLPMAAKKAGMSFEGLVDGLVAMAMRR